ncbi:MAG TPA: hypothetical protein DDW84_06345 [Phycisphaerales bacterium]|nr:hypothetical protein [Phycisphaerales bacterium]HBR19996.1 hypothetical protein [Phycisphaerales bacterium]
MTEKNKTMRTRYQPVDNGYEIIGSREMFNRTLYGSHVNDDLAERYFTFAGDLPLFMGAVTDWSKHTACHFAKNGVLMSGLALTRGAKSPSFWSSDIDELSHWFHNAEDVVSVFRNGWMEYELQQFSPWFPDVKVNISAFPLMPEDGFLVHYQIKTDQRVIFTAGFGGVTDFIGRLEHSRVKARNFSVSDCENNTVKCGRNRALVSGARGNMWIGASFPVEVETGDASSLQNDDPGMFLGSKAAKTGCPVVKMFSEIGAGQTLDGFIVVIRNQDESVLDKWLKCKDPAAYLKQQINLKKSAISVHTPDAMLNQTVPSTVLAVDASWHKNAFYHGAYGYHAPFLGWRNWYGPTVIGWHDRVGTAIKSHFADIRKDAPGKEAVWYDGKDRPDLDHEGTQYHQIRNSTGFIPAILGKNDIYNMQEVAINMFFHHLERTGDIKLAKKMFGDVKGILDWEERILDPDNDGLYQNFLNTWISDGHSYNGGGCTQASAYNYSANLMMAKLADKFGYPDKVFKKRSEKILKSIKTKLWMPAKGLIAEYIDTIGNKLVHPSPELSSIYLAVDCGVVDMFQAYQMFRFTETELRNEKTLNRKGRLAYSSNWYPKKYSTCGLFPAENMHLALAYFQTGLKEKGLEILDAIVDGYYLGKNPGLIAHVLSGHGCADMGDQDFTDVSSMYLRLIVEGLYGIRFHLLDDIIEISPNFPSDWTHANIKLKDIALNYCRDGNQENLSFYCDKKCSKIIKLPLRSARIEDVLLNNAPVKYKTEAAVNCCYLIVETETAGFNHLQVIHGNQSIPAIKYSPSAFMGNQLAVEVSNGEIIDYQDPSGAFDNISVSHNKLYAGVKAESGNHTMFVRVKVDDFDGWLAADFLIEEKTTQNIISFEKSITSKFEPIDISEHFNSSLRELHTLEYKSPRPKGYSIGVRLNGRYAWEWNHAGHNAVKIDDAVLRQSKGIFKTPSGIKFLVPENGQDIACASLWDNFPTIIDIPLKGKANELALFFIGVTNAMQSWVENARFTVTYHDGSKQIVNLMHPKNFDDWLVPALQTENETAYFSDYNHGIVQRIILEPKKELTKISVEAVANEIIIGLLGISIRRK